MKFKDFGKIGQDKPVSPGVPFEGTFGCHLCDEIVDVATFDPAAQAMSWVCPKGHVSVMEWKL